MDMQNVSNLTIPEGEVRTIHDKDSKLLWGRVNYDTKYAGDIFQQTYSGKNLFDKSATPVSHWQANVDVFQNGIKVTSINNSGVCYSQYRFSFTTSQIVNMYLSFEMSGNGSVNIYFRDENDTSVKSVTNQVSSFLITNVPTTAKSIQMFFYGDTSATGKVVTYDNIQLEIGSSQTSYEPFVGGMASPNPQFPQPIQVVTGIQTISITDGTNTQNFAVDLGSTELCKIGTYQDYIYKGGGDWYVHKEINKVTLNGSESWGGSNSKYNYSSADIVAQPLTQDAPIVAVSNYLTASNYWAISNNLADNIVSGYYNGGQIRTRVTSFATVTDWKTWLTTHNLTVYYVLATPTDTQITDVTLISQLDAIHQWLTRYGYNATVSGNLPLIVNRTNL